jgi:hypothetical protein
MIVPTNMPPTERHTVLPTPPAGWLPPERWQPDPTWPPAPDGWQFWVQS